MRKNKANQIFQFKKFSINQEDCAMKICTDACIFGACIDISESESILDIGTGTGLLSLMIAQRTENNPNPSQITAIEIEENAFLRAKENFENSDYRKRLSIFNFAIQDFSKNTTLEYEHIISNPPFFLHQQKTENTSKNLALHSEALSFDELLVAIQKLLSTSGKCDILLPAFEMDIFIKKAEQYGLFPQRKLNILNRKEDMDKIFRVITRFRRTQNEVVEEKTFVIYKSKEEKNIELNRGYTDEFVELLKDFYLIF
ncbi:tRNA1(Val) (adenine(37)-N6)-methyltransferase [Bernardetia sp.]|uniref:tRNA1(Val) (adenine(37)-N6)-methyltransferase n=1 Tax=Bernardetia sp. TaxID=1937974 RepID=UPI0025BF2521|nr:methyltransferase [Bernardetia sp.]